MKLHTIDFDLLAELAEGRNVAANLYLLIDSSRQYVNERMTELYKKGLVDRVGPNDHSGLYEITEKGRVVLKHREIHGQADVDFDALVAQELADGHDTMGCETTK